MKQKKWFISFLLVTLWMVSGCSPEKPVQTSPRTVEKIQITQNGTALTRSYVRPEKMEQILTYLRLLHPKSLPDNEALPGSDSMIEIQIFFSDGTQYTYRQKAHYLQAQSKDWKAIDKDQAQKLSSLLLTIPTDL